ncbi:hypothetical protein D3C75_1067220 [compost metagenome]
MRAADRPQTLFRLQQQFEQREHARRPLKQEVACPARRDTGMRQQTPTGGRRLLGVAHDQKVGFLRFAHVQPGGRGTASQDLQLLGEQALLIVIQTD